MDTRGAPLLLRNLTPSAARLRFRHLGHEIWDTWLAGHGQLHIPDPRHAEVHITARYVDPVTQVGCSLPTRLSSTGEKPDPATRLVAQVAMSGNACGFMVEKESSNRPGEIQFLNLTNGEVDFTLDYRRTPFGLFLCLPSQGESHFHPDKIELSATVNGYTTAPMPLRAWNIELAVEMLAAAPDYPVIRQLDSHPY